MTNKRNIIVLTFVLCLSASALPAQFRLPSMDVQVKSGVTLLPDMSDNYDNNYYYQAICIQAELNVHISQYVAAGAFFSSSINSYSQTDFSSDFGGHTSYPSTHQLYGVKLRLSTGRKPRLRPFAELNFGKLEMYIEKENYRISSSSTFLGGSLGLMVRLNNKFYLVLPQITVRPRSETFFFEAPGDFAFGSYPPILEFTGGISYNFGKKK